MKFGKFAAVAALSMVLAACSGAGPKESVGGLTGAVVGGVIGNQFGKGQGKEVATAIGAVAGAVIGSEIGRTLDENDRRMATRAWGNALEYGRSGAPTSWNNPDSGNRGFVVPSESFRTGGRDCRGYTQTIFVDGRPEVARGNACRRMDGSWDVVG